VIDKTHTDGLLHEIGSPPPAMALTAVSVAIPTLNGGAQLLELLEAVFSQRIDGPLEVLIADSESTDGSIQRALGRFPEIRLFAVQRQHFDHGLVRSALVARARSPKVALFSQDALPLGTDYLASMAAVLEQPDIAGVYARQLPRGDADPLIRAQLECWTPPPEDNAAAGPIIKGLVEGQTLDQLGPLERMKLARFDNVASMVQTELIEELPFPAREFGEDIAWGAQILERGLRIAYLPSACVEHHHPPNLWGIFARHRIAHRQARTEFGLHAVPGLRHLALALLGGIPEDLRAGPIWALRGLPRRCAALLGQWAGGRQPATGKTAQERHR